MVQIIIDVLYNSIGELLTLDQLDKLSKEINDAIVSNQTVLRSLLLDEFCDGHLESIDLITEIVTSQP